MKKDIRITNSELARITRLPISKVRRNTKEFLPPDQQASRRSGYSRRFNLEDAFKIILGTHLVSILGYSFPDARIIISDIWPWAESVDLLPGKSAREAWISLKRLLRDPEIINIIPSKSLQRTGIDTEANYYEVRIIKDTMSSGFLYSICGDIKFESWRITDPKRDKVMMLSRQTFHYNFNPRGSYAIGNPTFEWDLIRTSVPYFSTPIIDKEGLEYDSSKLLRFQSLLTQFLYRIFDPLDGVAKHTEV